MVEKNISINKILKEVYRLHSQNERMEQWKFFYGLISCGAAVDLVNTLEKH